MTAKKLAAAEDDDDHPRGRGWQIIHSLVVIELLLLTATLLASVYSQYINTAREHEMKTIDLMWHFQDRYDNLVWEIAPAVHDDAGARAYYGRYWNMQLEQFEYWQQGLIEDDVYAYWMALRRATYNDPARPFPSLPDYTFARGWEEAKQDLHVDVDTYGFGRFMEEVMKTHHDVRAIMARYKRPSLNPIL